MKTDINIKVRFKTTAEGERNMPISINKASFYACPLLLDGQAFDCRIFLNEQIMWKQVVENPSEGQVLRGLNNDPRFPVEAGFQKMAVNRQLSDGTSIEIHYQYNTIVDKAFDVKIVPNKK